MKDKSSSPRCLKPITALSGALRAYSGDASPRYRQLIELVYDGTLNLEQHNGRWYFDDAAVPEIARALRELGFMPPSPDVAVRLDAQTPPARSRRLRARVSCPVSP